MSKVECALCGEEGARSQFVPAPLHETLEAEVVEMLEVCCGCVEWVRESVRETLPPCPGCGLTNAGALAFTVEPCVCGQHYEPSHGFCLACAEPWGVFRRDGDPD